MHQVGRGGPRLGSGRGRPRARWSLSPRTGSLQPSPPHFVHLPAREEELWTLTATRKQRKQQTTRHRRPHLGCDGGCPRARWCQPPRAQPLESPPRRFRHGRPNLDFRFLQISCGVSIAKTPAKSNSTLNLTACSTCSKVEFSSRENLNLTAFSRRRSVLPSHVMPFKRAQLVALVRS